MRRACACLPAILLFETAAFASVLGNQSLVDEARAFAVDDARGAIAVEFTAQHTGRLNFASFHLTAVGSAGGTDRSYKTGIREPAAGGEPGAWLGTQTMRTAQSAGWFEVNIAADLIAGQTYFLMLESANTGTNRIASVTASAPEIDRVPATQAESPRALWERSATGTWSAIAGVEPVFLLRYQQTESACGSSYPRVEGNPYEARSMAYVWRDATVSQTFIAPGPVQVSSIEVLLEAATGRPDARLETSSGTVLASGLLRQGAAQGAAVWYTLPVDPAVALAANQTYRLVLSTQLASVRAEWVTSKTKASSDPCPTYSRATFQGAEHYVAIKQGVSTLERVEEDAIFRLAACSADHVYYRDADGDGFGDPAVSQNGCSPPDGFVVTAGDCDDTTAAVHPGADEDCDGLDNDCNGAVDDIPASAVPQCEETRGVCGEARKQCDGASGWRSCTEEDYGPDYEGFESRCDGLDNDCNGAIDDIAASRAEPCEKTIGVCANSTRLCSEGQWLPCDDSRYGPLYQPVESLCDGQDNDCDGEIDEDPALEPCGRQYGVCAGAMKSCRNGFLVECTDADFARHNPAYEFPVETLCDGLDNDCDGIVDNVFSATQELCPKQLGVCEGSVRLCGGGQAGDCSETDYASHSAAYEAEETLCDGLDNDCDGTVDNLPERLLPACENQKGVCAGTRKECRLGEIVGCAPADFALNLPGYESPEVSCDGLDNDCDGEEDPPAVCAGADAGSASRDAGASPPPAAEPEGCGCSTAGTPLFALGLAALLPLRRRKRA
ncbi:MAG: MopE-related protein [Myxococcales bacterium]|jgi:MYXO-CTERM domain-containing protein